MSQTPVTGSDTAVLSAVALLELAVERLLTESPVDLPEQVALDRARSLLACTDRLVAARLAAVADVDRRELFALDAAGSTRGWLRVQPGGEAGQLVAARRLVRRPQVQAALGAGRISARAAEQVCGVLDRVPAQLAEPLVQAVLLDGIGSLLQTFTGGLVPDDAVTPELLAAREQAQQVLQAAAADSTASPAQRLEAPLVLLASRLTASHLGPALRELLEALLPDGADGIDRDPYFFELRELLDGDVDVRGHLTPEVGHALADEISRRVAQANAVAKKAREQDLADQHQTSDTRADMPLDADADADADSDADEPTGEDAVDDPADDDPADDDPADDDPADDEPDDGGRDDDGRELLDRWDAALAAAAAQPVPQPEPAFDAGPTRPVSAGRRRHDALAQLLHDLRDIAPGSGQPLPHRLTIIATLDALEGRLGALPAQLATSGPAATLTTTQLRRLGCSSELDAVLLDALGNPVGASHTRRNLTRRERRALKAQWGTTCAVLGCPSTLTVPHHVEPYWLTGRTRLRDIIPACEHCHHDLHDGHRTLQLRDGRLINEHGWVSTTAA